MGKTGKAQANGIEMDRMGQNRQADRQAKGT
jgi:hypothetical protein